MVKKKKVPVRRRAPRAKRLTKLDHLTASVVQDFGHLSTADIVRRRQIILPEVNVLDEQVLDLQRALADARDRRARLEATLRGLALAIGKRA